MRRDVLILCWRPAATDAMANAVERLSQTADAEAAWRRAYCAPGVRIWRRGPADLPIQQTDDGRGLVLGEVFPHPDGPSTLRLSSDPHQLCRDVWGPYLALRLDGRGGWSVFREPSGQHDVLTWPLHEGLAVVATTMAQLPFGFAPRRQSLNWDRIIAFVTVPVAATTDVLFADANGVGPGEEVAAGGGPAKTVWSPLHHTAPLDATPSELAAAFVSRLDACTSALVGGHDRIVMELSGGLDSSAVAAAVQATGHAGRIVTWLNYADPRPESDERIYARAVTDRLGVELTTKVRKPAPLEPDRFADLGRQTWPAIAGVDESRDLDQVARIDATGATAILSGQGGDGVFFQMISPLVAADLWRAEGLGKLLVDPRLAQIARRTRTSVWRVLLDAHRGLRKRGSGENNINALVTSAASAQAAGTEHAWVRAAADSDLPPAKREHIRAFATGQFNHSASRRRQRAELLFPLLAQPIMELGLGVPVPVLASGNHARPFQRQAFADRLPPLVRERRAKSHVAAYLAQMMALSAESLRPYLIDGVLADAGVLDRTRLATSLDPNVLIQTGAANDLVGPIAVEAWVRHWQGRVSDWPATRWGR